ncbi:CAVP-target protein-like [Glandiceps talaboti]
MPNACSHGNIATVKSQTSDDLVHLPVQYHDIIPTTTTIPLQLIISTLLHYLIACLLASNISSILIHLFTLAEDIYGSYTSQDDTEVSDPDEPEPNKEASNKEEAIDIDLKDPEVAAAAKKIQSVFRRRNVQKETAKKPKFTQELDDIDVCEGSAVRLDCKIESKLEVTIRWFKDDIDITDNEHYCIEYGDNNLVSLIIAEVEEEDDGTYTCEASNTAGTTTSTADIFVEEFVEAKDQTPVQTPVFKPAARLTLPISSTGFEEKSTNEQLPEFILRLRNKTVAMDCITKLSVTVKGKPHPTIRWEKEGEALETGERYEIFEEKGVYTLEIYDTDVFDSGTYSCIATNSVGSVSCSCNVTIEG